MRQIALNDTASFDLPIMVRDGVEVMSSVDLAKMCGQTHSDFLKKVPKVLNGGQGKFYSSYLNAQNIHRSSKSAGIAKKWRTRKIFLVLFE